MGDDALPANLVAEWKEDDTSAGKPFPSYAGLLLKRGTAQGESRYSWTVDFAARRTKARAEMQPFLEEAAAIKAAVVESKEELKRLKKDKADKKTLAALQEKIRNQEKGAKDQEMQAAAINAAVFDLKAVNPNAVTKVDERSPLEIITCIERQGRVVTVALARLGMLLAE